MAKKQTLKEWDMGQFCRNYRPKPPCKPAKVRKTDSAGNVYKSKRKKDYPTSVIC